MLQLRRERVEVRAHVRIQVWVCELRPRVVREAEVSLDVALVDLPDLGQQKLVDLFGASVLLLQLLDFLVAAQVLVGTQAAYADPRTVACEVPNRQQISIHDAQRLQRENGLLYLGEGPVVRFFFDQHLFV